MEQCTYLLPEYVYKWRNFFFVFLSLFYILIMPLSNSSASVPSNNGVTPRRGGRVSGQVVSRYRSYVPPAGDRLVEAQIIVSHERAWE